MKTLTILLPCALFFVTPVRAVTFDWAIIGDPGNDFDTHGSGYGGVDEIYRISKHEVTNAQYTEFLNAVDPTGVNESKLYNFGMSGVRGGIDNTGGADGAHYVAKPGREQNPVTFVSFIEAMRFTNWLHNGQGSADTESGAYTMETDRRRMGLDEVRSTDARFWIPSEDEWYKAAYYDPASGVYYDYPTGTDTDPYSDNPASLNTPDDTNVANFAWNDGLPNGYHDGWAVPGSTSFDENRDYLNDVGAYSLAASPNGTFDQGGNAFEWTEGLTLSGSGRVLRGGSWNLGLREMRADVGRGDNWRWGELPRAELHYIGFRVAAGPGIPGDCSEDGGLNSADLACVSSIEVRDVVLEALNSRPGDLDGDGEVAFADFLTLASHFGQETATYAEGNIDLVGGVEFNDFLELANNFGNLVDDVATVPEPATLSTVWLALTVLLSCPRRSAHCP